MIELTIMDDIMRPIPKSTLLLVMIIVFGVSIIASIIFGNRASKQKTGILEILLFAFIIVGSVIIEMILIAYYFPLKMHIISNILGLTAFGLIFLVSSLIVLTLFLKYVKKNPTDFIYNNEINFEAGPVFGTIFGFSMVGIMMLGATGTGWLEQIIPESVKGLIPFLIIISPLVLGIVIAIKSRKWMLNLMTYVVRKNLPEEVRTKLVENNED
ncbi:hypothetical protein NR996_01920 [Lactobacillus rodentium]|uniref:Uncharacterized protein n=1 Tax=Lactobacillus rodentium TaxID=947835 RepID=A0A2Z6T6K6_9LACO|nr:hypothetical protein [Lactobacillus rodentium]MCR1894169.1 hypothetical protein [Lactobacillus rodentium]GBG04466.1 hypothetical protein LrDSM24759_03800 [Lactobacillus rodentium]